MCEYRDEQIVWEERDRERDRELELERELEQEAERQRELEQEFQARADKPERAAEDELRLRE